MKAVIALLCLLSAAATATACREGNEPSIITLNNTSELRAGVLVNWPRSTSPIIVEPGETVSLPPRAVRRLMLFFYDEENGFSPVEDPTFSLDLTEELRGDLTIDITGPPLSIETSR